MGSKVKKVLSIASIAMGAYGAYSALTAGGAIGSAAAQGTGAAGGIVGSTGEIGSTLATTAGGLGQATAGTTATGLVSAETLSKVGQLAQVGSSIGQLKSQVAQSSALAKAEKAQEEQQRAEERFREAETRRQRLDIIEQGRVARGEMEAGAAASGVGPGTSSYVGGMGSVSSKTASNLSALEMARGASQANLSLAQKQSQFQGDYYRNKGMQTGWSAVGAVGENIFKNSEKLAGGDLFSIFG